MENIYAALLLHKAGKEISEENMKSVIKAAGAEADEGQIKSLITSLKGVDIDKELESATLSVGAPSGGASEKTESEAPKEEEKKEEKEEEKAPAAEGLSALFG